MSWTVDSAARFYRVPIIDYSEGGMPCWGPRRGVLIGSGCGLMTAVMDYVPFRWCVDTDELRGQRGVRLADFMQMAQALTGMLAVCGWFSYSDPEPLRAAVRSCPDPYAVPVYFGGDTPANVPGAVARLEDFITLCQMQYHLPHVIYSPTT